MDSTLARCPSSLIATLPQVRDWTQARRGLMAHHFVIAALKAEIETLFNQSESNLRVKRRNLWNFLMPGFPIAPKDLELNLEQDTALQKAFNYASFVNRIEFESCDYTLLWQVYQTILSEATLATSDPSPEEIQNFESARNFLHQIQETTDSLEPRTTIFDSPAVIAYKQYQATYLQAELEYNTRRQAALESNDPQVVREWSLNKAVYQRQVETARRNWIAQGFKNEVEKALVAINQIGKRNPQMLWDQWREEFAAAKRTTPDDQDFYLTEFSPPRFYQAGVPWQQLSLDFSEVELGQVQEDGAISNLTTQDIELLGLSLQVDLIQVQVLRPWLNPTLFESRFWKWADNRDPLSDGKEPPKGTLTDYTTSVVLARNLKIKLVPNAKENTTLIQNIRARKSISWGLFSLNNATLSDSNSIQSDAIQVIALVGQKLPKSPNPDPKLIWSNDLSEEVKSNEH
jgi:hypothetical protein